MRRSWGTAAALALLGAAASVLPVRAQDQEQVNVAFGRDEGKRQTIFQSLSQFSSYGATVGLMQIMGGDIGKDVTARPVMQAVFRYRFSENWIGTGEFGFGWNAMEGDTVVTMSFGTLGVARRIGTLLGMDLRASGGAGMYRWNHKYSGNSLRDSHIVQTDGGPVDLGTQRFYRGISPGGYLGLETERRLTRYVTFIAMLQGHYVFTADEEKFNYLFDQNHVMTTLRIGASYHFSPYQGILWERSGDKKIRLESGREGK